MKFLNDNRNNPWFWLFVGIAAILFFAMPLMSRSAGNSGDEDKFQIPQGRFVLDYYRTDGADTTCLQDMVMLNGKEQSWNLKYYGCSFDVVTQWINDLFGFEDLAKTRHACNAFLGWLIVLFGGLIAWRIAGWRAGVFAMLLLFFSPRLLGHSFNNPKDIPLAAGIIMSIYYIMMFFRQAKVEAAKPVKGHKKSDTDSVDKRHRIISIVLIVLSAIILFPTAGIGLTLLLVILMACCLLFKSAPKFNPLTLIMLALSLAIAVSNRIGGLIAVGYMGLWGLLWLIANRKNITGAIFGKTLLVAVCTCAVGFFGGLLLWPFAMQNPVHNSMEAFRLMSQFDVQLRQLFEGTMMMSSNLPWYYTPKFMLLTIPIAVMLGWVLYFFFGAFRKERWLESVMLYFCFLFPVIWIVATGANVYGGWRHSLFTYAPMAVTAALGYDALAVWAGRKSNRSVVELVVSLVPILLIVPPALHTFRNHPYEYVYFNELGGGVKNAFGKYELDYYYHSMREATEWVVANAEPKSDGSKTLVGSWHIESTKYFLRNDTNRFETRFVRWGQRYEFDWDYLVFPITGISSDYLLGPAFPPADCVHTVDVDGCPIAVVLKRNGKDDYYGIQQLRAGNVDSAIVLFNKALESNPTNETALTQLAQISLQRGQSDSAALYSQRILDSDPTNPQATQMLIYAYLNQGRQDEAAALLDKVKARGQDAYAFSLTAQLYARQGNVNAALAELNAMLDRGLMDQDALNLYVQIRASQGIDQNNAMYAFYTAYANGLEKNGDVKSATALRNQLHSQR